MQLFGCVRAGAAPRACVRAYWSGGAASRVCGLSRRPPSRAARAPPPAPPQPRCNSPVAPFTVPASAIAFSDRPCLQSNTNIRTILLAVLFVNCTCIIVQLIIVCNTGIGNFKSILCSVVEVDKSFCEI